MHQRQIKIAPSILSGDFGHLSDEAKRIEASGADYLHIDIMDGNFVNNITMGAKAVAAINRATNMFLDVHLMIYNPFEYIEAFVESGADMITFHFEATEEVDETLKYIRRCNVKAGLAFCPETAESMVINFLDKCDMILLMTVHPGHGGQAFMPEVLEKIQYTRDICNKLKIDMDIEVDGGIDPITARQCVQAGANIFVSGSYIFNNLHMNESVHTLREAVHTRQK